MMNEPAKQSVTIQDVDQALNRAIESAHWAKQHDDEEALKILKSFLDNSIHSRNDLFYYVAKQSRQQQEATIMTRLPVEEVARMYSEAIGGGSASSITSCMYRGTTIRGSSIYDLNYTSSHPIIMFIRKCRGGLRGELNEDHFTIMRLVPPPPPREEKKSLWQRFLDKVL